MFFCELPYKCAHINEKGDVFPCCIAFCSNYSFGNILETPFEEIWNGERAQKFRKQFQDNKYDYCNTEICLPLNTGDIELKNNTISNNSIAFLIGIDRLCNVKCIFCNPENRIPDSKFYDFPKWSKGLFDRAERVNVCCLGEVLFSPFARKLINYLISNYKNIRCYDITTNGLLFNEETLSDLNIINKLGRVGISFHSLCEKNYNKLVLNSNFKQVMKNVKYAIKLKRIGKIETLDFRFVITSYNYKEMIDFAKFAKRNNANAIFMNCLPFNEDEFYKSINIIDPSHNEHNEFKKILKNPIFKESFVNISQELIDTI